MHATAKSEEADPIHLVPKGAPLDKLSIVLPAAVGARVRAHAKREKVTISSLIAVAVTEYLRDHGSR